MHPPAQPAPDIAPGMVVASLCYVQTLVGPVSAALLVRFGELARRRATTGATAS